MIIVYGGTFNPPTKAHEEIANLLIEKYNPEKFIFLPVGDSYTWKDNFVSFKHRKKMLKLVFNDEIFEINTLENKKRYKGTYWALNELKETHKSDVYFVMGADNIEQLDKWINYEKLISEHNFIVLTREGYDPVKLIKEKFPENVKNFSVVEYHSEISSRKYRENTTLEHFLNKKVVSYIKGHNLYGGNDAKA